MKLQLVLSPFDVKLAITNHVAEHMGIDLTESNIPDEVFQEIALEIDSDGVSVGTTKPVEDSSTEAAEPPKKKRNRRTKAQIEADKKAEEEAEAAALKAEEDSVEAPETSGEEPSEEKVKELSKKRTPINKLLGEEPEEITEADLADEGTLDDDVPFEPDEKKEPEVAEEQPVKKKRSLFN